MKKLLILTLAGGLALSASAQSNHYDRPVPPRDRKAQIHQKHVRELDRRIAIINNDYNSQINYVRNNPHLNKRQKNKKIKSLEKERNLAINRCRDNYSKNYREGYAKGNRHKDRNKW